MTKSQLADNKSQTQKGRHRSGKKLYTISAYSSMDLNEDVVFDRNSVFLPEYDDYDPFWHIRRKTQLTFI